MSEFEKSFSILKWLSECSCSWMKTCILLSLFPTHPSVDKMHLMLTELCSSYSLCSNFIIFDHIVIPAEFLLSHLETRLSEYAEFLNFTKECVKCTKCNNQQVDICNYLFLNVLLHLICRWGPLHSHKTDYSKEQLHYFLKEHNVKVNEMIFLCAQIHWDNIDGLTECWEKTIKFRLGNGAGATTCFFVLCLRSLS